MGEYKVVDAREISRWHLEADVVVVGLGAAGCCAALEARAAGAEVLVLERASGGGGTTLFAAGHFYLGGGTRVQKAVGVEDTAEDMFRYLMAVTPQPDEEKIRLYCDGSVAHFDWLVEQGVPFEDSWHREKNVMQMTSECLIESGNEAAHPFRNLAKPAPRGHKVAMEGEAGGAKLIDVLVERCRKKGVRIQTDTWVQNLAREGARITGVCARYEGGVQNIRARKAVVLAAGQFGMNEEMVRAHCKDLRDPRIERQGSACDDGAGHQLGAAAGGVLEHMEGNLVTTPFYPPEALLKGIIVNREGARFVAEDSYHSRSSIMCLQQPEGIAYLIADDSFFARPLFGWQELVDAWETVAEMEAALNIAEGKLQRTIAEYNRHAAKGEDPVLHKAAKWLTPLTHPPYAALDLRVGHAKYVGFPLGGLRVSSAGEVLRSDNSAISGLYAAGGCASNIAQDGLGYSSGTCIGEATFFGRRAGRHAVRGAL